jgi:hypothetical protein
LDTVLVVGECHLEMAEEAVTGRGIESNKINKMKVWDKKEMRLIK